MHTSTLAALFSLAAFCSATRVDFYSDRGCSLFLGNLDIPSEQGCTTLPDGNTALSAKVPGEMATDCAIELYSDASCNTLQAILDWGVDNGGESCPFYLFS
ncbi:hypothetical protein BCR34DRAFT_242488 [Clohesyomyces aquaticus]|uniref:Uncharacterized protein n=1 Tax=Clohesyomyces aquaticus TaxID=1231657 RepID=A0A1Y1ZVB2_9PLEO|nr:hypothetical protein BCR34DRAFT_242488 [Clohesyomyces aquaticus]